MKVAGYCRVSTDKEDQTNSFASQQRFFREYIEHHPDWELHDIYADEGITGTNTKKRFEFNRMIRDAHAGKFQLIITKEISRFSRNILDTISYTRKLKELGVGVLFMTENLNTLNPESEMMLTFMGTIAQEESRRTSVRVKWGQTRQMERGVVFGHSMLGYDVQNGKITINPAGADIVRLIFQKYAVEQKGTSVIARELRERGLRSLTGNANWTAPQILKILKNEKYAGDLVQKKTITPNYLTHEKKYNHGQEPAVIIYNHHEPIVSRELWNRVQQTLASRNRRKCIARSCSTRYILSGKIICGECGAPFVARTKALANGESYRRWCCRTAAEQGSSVCNIGKLVRDDDGINMVRIAFRSLNLDHGKIIRDVYEKAQAAIQAGERASAVSLPKLEKEILFLEKKKSRVLDAFFSGEITADEMKAAKDQYDRDISVLKAEIAKDIPKIQDNNMTLQFLSELIEMKSDNNILYGYLLNSITVFHDKHTELRFRHLPHIFHFNYLGSETNGTKHVIMPKSSV